MASSAVARIRRTLGGSLPSSVLQCMSYSDAGLDGHILRSSGASTYGDPLVDTPLSGEFSPAVLKIETYGADRPVLHKNSYSTRRFKACRVYGIVDAAWERVTQLPITVLKPHVSRTGLNEEKRPVSNSRRASRDVAQESCHDDSLRKGFVCGNKQPSGSICERGDRHLRNASTTSEAIAILKHRQQLGLHIDSYMFVETLKRCSKGKDLKAATQVHDCIIQSGMERDPYVATTLLNAYIKCGRLQDARRVFDGIASTNRNVITWSMLIGAYARSGYGVEAYRLFLQMKQEGFTPNAITYMSILNPSASAGALEWVKDIHRHARRGGLESDLGVGGALIHMYAKSGSIGEAREVFDSLEKRNVIIWNVMIGAYAESGCGGEAYRLFVQMQREGFTPNAVTYINILNASASESALEWVKEVHGHAFKAGLESDLRVGSALVRMYAKSGSIDDARLVFDRMENRDVITWTMMIGAYSEGSCGEEAYRLFLQMKQEGFKPDAVTYVSILNASASAGALEWVKQVHNYAIEAGLESDLRVGNTLIHMYAKCGSIGEARLLFDKLEERDVITWNVMIAAYAGSGCGAEAYRLFLQMKREGFTPNTITYMSILNASANAGALEWVKEVHSHARRAGLESDLGVGAALIHVYAKSGSGGEAREVFDRLEKRDVITWNVMIGGLAQHGYGHQALELFKRMNADGVMADATTFVAVLSACCHAGLLDEGRRLFLAMAEGNGIEPDVTHYNCMVDLFGRAGHLEEAKLFIGDMPIEASGATWGALLSACRSSGNVELGEFSAKECLKLEPKNASTYVLLSNIYAAAGQWEKVSSVRTLMQERRVQKEPGRSWIEVDNKIYEFVVSDTSHPEAKAIYSVLKDLTEKLKAEGYIPDTQLVLHNICEQDKELALCSHSEKLAIAYGILRIPPGKPIRVFKNLRVCSDCHKATKLISKVTGREIIARDANRFHHFRDGVCSCGDYW